MDNTPFYADGLRFSCTRCSRCCRHTPGYVFLSEGDLRRLSTFLAMTRDELVRTHCRQVRFGQFKRLSLTEKPNLDCIFWEGDGCSVYSARPFQCQSFPFWSTHLGSPEDWQNAAETCPGVGKGQLHPRDEIERWMRRRREEGYVES